MRKIPLAGIALEELKRIYKEVAEALSEVSSRLLEFQSQQGI